MSSEPPQSRSSGIQDALGADATVKLFLLQNEPVFRRLDELREKASLFLSGLRKWQLIN
jgi:hypothetical protein